MLKDLVRRFIRRWSSTPCHSSKYIYPVVVTSLFDEMEVGGQCHDWLTDQGLHRDVDYESSWWFVPGKRDHYRFAFKLEIHQRLFRQRWLANVKS